MSYYNPYTNSSDAEKDYNEHPGCRAKIKAICDRVGITLSHEEISALCGEFGAINAKEFWDILSKTTDEELKKKIEKIRKKRKILENYLQSQYATAAAGVY